MGVQGLTERPRCIKKGIVGVQGLTERPTPSWYLRKGTVGM